MVRRLARVPGGFRDIEHNPGLFWERLHRLDTLQRLSAKFHAVAALVLEAPGLGPGAGRLAGCAMPQQSCTTSLVTATVPATATAERLAAAPGDQRQFLATASPASRPGCAVSALSEKLTPQWTVSDTVNVKITSTADSTNGLATCLGTTEAPVTVTAIRGTSSGSPSETLGTATITCK